MAIVVKSKRKRQRKVPGATPLMMLRARQHGILNPVVAARSAKKAGLPYAVAVAVLLRESSGGRNVWGSDDTWMIGYGEVTEEAYKVYRFHKRLPCLGAQGVGPCQLTSDVYQDQADELGGCWKIGPNMVVSFRLLASMYDDSESWLDAFTRYNGSATYGREMVALMEECRDWLKAPE